MTYDYRCESCDIEFELSVPISKRDDRCSEPCTECGSKVVRIPSLPGINYQGAMSLQRKAGDGWNDLLGKIKKGAGPRSTIQTK